jgi:hypothetical protein
MLLSRLMLLEFSRAVAVTLRLLQLRLLLVFSSLMLPLMRLLQFYPIAVGVVVAAGVFVVADCCLLRSLLLTPQI